MPKFDKSKAHFKKTTRWDHKYEDYPYKRYQLTLPARIHNHAEVRRLMEYYGLTVAQFAKKCGISEDMAEYLSAPARDPRAGSHVVINDEVVYNGWNPTTEWTLATLEIIEQTFNRTQGGK